MVLKAHHGLTAQVVALVHVISDHSILLAHGVEIQRAQKVALLSVPGFVVAAQNLIAAANGQKYLFIFDGSLDLRRFFAGEILEQHALLKVLAAANEKQVVFGRLQLIANGHALYITVNAPPFQTLFEARDIAPVTVKVQNIGIEMANIQFHNYASQYSLNP